MLLLYVSMFLLCISFRKVLSQGQTKQCHFGLNWVHLLKYMVACYPNMGIDILDKYIYIYLHGISNIYH